MTDASPPDRTDVWGQILVEARELRSKQDLRLTALQRQSQVVVAGFLAISAIVAAAVSSLQADPARAAERIIPVIWDCVNSTEPVAGSHDDKGEPDVRIVVNRGLLPDRWFPESWHRWWTSHRKRKPAPAS